MRRMFATSIAPDYRAPNLPRLRRGSAMRGGASVVATGPSTGTTAVAAGATEVLTLDIVEDCHLDNLIVQSTDLTNTIVTDIEVDNDGLLNGQVPAALFSHDSLHSPTFGHFVEKNSTVRVSVRNDSASSIDVAAAFTAMEADSQ